MTESALQARIPVNEPLVGERELEYVTDCVRSGWISSEGDYVRRFERAWADYCGVEHGIAIANGTAAVFAAVDALRLEPRAEVIMPTFTIVGCAYAVLAAGAVPVLVDSDPETWTMDPGEVAARVTERTAAIMAVHIYGHPADMGPLRDVARRNSLKIVEDAAEAHGARYKGGRAGSLGDIACFSFYANKILTTGEGGMVVTDDPGLAARVRSYINLGFRSERRFYHTEVGYNHRLTNVQAAIGLAQTETIDARVARKREIGRRYLELLADVEGIALPVERPWAENVYWMFGVVISDDAGFDAVELARRLHARGIDTRPFFLGMHEQPVLLEQGLFAGERYPVAERIARQGLYLPSGLTLADAQIERVVDELKGVLTA
ncbi:MAG TPA: DegT/DnrJ/EryC1/StrS family aminotransferase [Gaiellaceae bacterium]|nr:DegT/DnrJ/EryC1/StrS family aminotransferase [Gaiellaceae bacterium]